MLKQWRSSGLARLSSLYIVHLLTGRINKICKIYKEGKIEADRLLGPEGPATQTAGSTWHEGLQGDRNLHTAGRCLC